MFKITNFKSFYNRRENGSLIGWLWPLIIAHKESQISFRSLTLFNSNYHIKLEYTNVQFVHAILIILCMLHTIYNLYKETIGHF